MRAPAARCGASTAAAEYSPGLHCRAPRADSIINPEAPLALRLSGQLLLGVVKVYSKKVGYLYQDCNDALVKIKEARAPARTLAVRPAHAAVCASAASFATIGDGVRPHSGLL